MILKVMGVFLSVAVPSFLAKVRNRKQAEAREYVSSINKIQQAYFAEKNVFSASVKPLGIGIKTETENYKSSIRKSKKATFNHGVSKQKDLKSYVGGVFVIPAKKFDSNASKKKITTTSILCKADSAGTIKLPEPTNQNGKIACPTGTGELTDRYY
ncbi:type IV pilin-like G/H family protein [Microcoleus sp. herbarium2]|uniref:type IV pilin-like G/H family protein n=1 Tax=Microcoleus sp. herbarium2 TaxID=3055433 RepID=UPI002FCF0C35